MPCEVNIRIESGPLGRFPDQNVDITVRSLSIGDVEKVAIIAARKALAALEEQGAQA